jgi:UDP-N-acetylglucosamine acyltransferase
VIHPTASIDHAALVGHDVEVGAYSVIGADVEIGEGCRIGPHVVISGPTVIGKRNRIYQFSSIGEAPQDLKYGGEPTRLVVGDDNVIREYVTFNRGTAEGHGETRIGSNNLFMAYCHVAHDCVVGSHIVFANAASLAGHVEVGDYATLGGFTSVHQFSRIGTRAFIGLGSVVTQDIPPFSTAAGNRARAVGINKVGLARKGFSKDAISALHKTFRLLLKSRKPREEALAEIQPLVDAYPEVDQLVNFIIDSQRGIAR